MSCLKLLLLVNPPSPVVSAELPYGSPQILATSRGSVFCRPTLNLPSSGLSKPTHASRLKRTPGVSMLPLGSSNSLSMRASRLKPHSGKTFCVLKIPHLLPLNQDTFKPTVEAPLVLTLVT